jgi:hypothetical protein
MDMVSIEVPVQTVSSEPKMKVETPGAPVKPRRTTNYELHKEGWATRTPVAQTLQSVRQTCPCTIATCPYLFARFPFCGIFTPTRTSPVKQRVETTGWCMYVRCTCMYVLYMYVYICSMWYMCLNAPQEMLNGFLLPVLYMPFFSHLDISTTPGAPPSSLVPLLVTGL